VSTLKLVAIPRVREAADTAHPGFPSYEVDHRDLVGLGHSTLAYSILVDAAV
jgi:hypothetical protein